MTPADAKLLHVYGDIPHQNAGTHLDGGLNDDGFWQGMLAQPSRAVAKSVRASKRKDGQAISLGVIEGIQGRPEVALLMANELSYFLIVILQRKHGLKGAGAIRMRIQHRLKHWELSNYKALVDDTISEILCSVGTGLRSADPDVVARQYNDVVLSGRLRQAVRMVTDRGGGGVLQPTDADTKSGAPVIEVLQGKHPDMREPPVDPELEALEKYEKHPRRGSCHRG